MARTYEAPTCRLKDDRELFSTFCGSSKTFKKFFMFIEELADSAKGEIAMEAPEDPIIRLLQDLEQKIKDFPPMKQSMRFGNKAFVQWHDWLKTVSLDRLSEMLPSETYQDAAVEAKSYLLTSFGEPERIDYGTGHEANFLAFMLCLREIGFYKKEENLTIALGIFPVYLKLVRMLQNTYMFEPAGSHGVWGLDDFHHVPYIIGAAQMLRNPPITPDKMIAECRQIKGNLMADSIVAILDVKTGAPFGETSPVLHDVLSTVTEWEKIYAGMCKMYLGEVMSKFPVMQHFLFGTILPFE